MRLRGTARALFAEPAIAGVTVSPDGEMVSYIRHRRYADTLIVHRLGEQRPSAVVTSGWPIGGHAWLPDGRTVAYVVSDGRRARDRLFTVDVITKDRKEIGPLDATRLTILDAAEHRAGGTLLAAVGDGGSPVLHRIAGAITGTGGALATLDRDGVVSRWFFDPDERLCAGTRLDPDGTLQVFARRGSAWVAVAGIAPPDALSTHPLEVDADGDRLLCIGPAGATAGLLAVELHDGGGIETLATHPERDLDYAVLHPRTRKTQLLVFAGPRPVYRPEDDTVAAVLEAVRREHGGDPQLVARSRDGGTWVALVDDAGRPPSYMVWRNRSGRAEPMPQPYPALHGLRLARPEQVAFAVRDGTTLHGYLTRPPRPRLRPIPLVLLVHGGPWACDRWEFVPEAQWLAACGYTCLQVNFRGSTGSGTALLNAADRDWGGLPQDDLDDAVAWAVAAGEAVPARVAIMGRSYGGYAALMAATARPRRFACAVAISAPTDLADFVAHLAGTSLPTRGVFAYRIGDPHRDREHLLARSPLTHAAAAHTPVLLAHGTLDPLVPFRQAERFAGALAAAGRPGRLVAFPGEGHGFVDARNRTRLANEVARFLAAHLD